MACRVCVVLTGALLIVGALSTPIDLVAQTTTTSPDETAVRELIRRYVNARELKDPAAIEALFTADADQYTTSGEWRRGRGQVVPGTLESSKRNPGARTITVQAVRFISPDVAIADGAYEITGTASTRRIWATIVTRREAGGWRIAAIRNMVPSER